ncbi:hypothetical protein NCTGTJJY_CDS0014 [Serratia phage 92A1]|nr:hypothetical protein NCTGTJJY_CDS0014 [Serratia phage 92A1]
MIKINIEQAKGLIKQYDTWVEENRESSRMTGFPARNDVYMQHMYNVMIYLDTQVEVAEHFNQTHIICSDEIVESIYKVI